MPPLPTLNPYGFCANGCPTANSATSSNRGGTSVNSDAGRYPDGYTLNANRHIFVLLVPYLGLWPSPIANSHKVQAAAIPAETVLNQRNRAETKSLVRS